MKPLPTIPGVRGWFLLLLVLGLFSGCGQGQEVPVADGEARPSAKDEQETPDSAPNQEDESADDPAKTAEDASTPAEEDKPERPADAPDRPKKPEVAHHLVLLDDSFSMSDTTGGEAAFERARWAVAGLLARLEGFDPSPRLTLLRVSRSSPRVGQAQPDVLTRELDEEGLRDVRDLLEDFAVTQFAMSPLDCWQDCADLLARPAVPDRVLHVVSDFRRNDWEAAARMAEKLQPLGEGNVHLDFIACTADMEGTPNLVLEQFAPNRSPLAPGVPLDMTLSVANRSLSPAEPFQASVELDGERVAVVDFTELPPGRIATRRIELEIGSAGGHRVSARLPEDVVAADNVRHAAIDVPERTRVLVIDESAGGRSALFVRLALRPGGKPETGYTPLVESPKFLGRHALDRFAGIVLVNFSTLAEEEIAALERYAAGGGGVVIFASPEANAGFLSDRLYRDGQGIFPLPVSGAAELPLPDEDQAAAPDVRFQPHPVFFLYQGKDNVFLESLQVQQYLAAAEDWEPARDDPVRVIATLRNGAPLVLESRFGQGRVLTFLTTAAPQWNNWARTPAFVVTLLEALAYVGGGGPSADEDHSVGEKLTVKFEADAYEPAVSFSRLGADGEPTGSVQVRDAEPLDGGEGRRAATFSGPTSSGFYAATLTRRHGGTQRRLYAVNVDAEEGRLEVTREARLRHLLEGLEFDYRSAAEFTGNP